jgi:hypothetical protein
LLFLAFLMLSRIPSWAEVIGIFMFVTLFTALLIFLAVVATGWMNTPRYVEKAVETSTGEVKLVGLVRHRPPNEYYELQQKDVPEQHRSYPDQPAGYPEFPVTLTIDKYGFRNGEVKDRYPIVAVGDSFVAGSHVSDKQAWTVLLSEKIGQDIYNLGVSGSDPQTYLNNYAMFGRQFKPELVIMMLYEGNDFKYRSPKKFDKKTGQQKLTTSQKIRRWSKASPVTKGLKRFSSEVLEQVGKDWPVPGYKESVGWMPVSLELADGNTAWYSFKPKRLLYLDYSPEEFSSSRNWEGVSGVFLEMKKLAEQEGFRLLFVYAPSKPHVVMPLVKDQVPADQLRNFAAFKEDDLPPADEFKQRIYDNMETQETVFMDFCGRQNLDCISLTKGLQQATLESVQTYYTYDQHWTPEGNQVAADVISGWLQQQGLSVKATPQLP